MPRMEDFLRQALRQALSQIEEQDRKAKRIMEEIIDHACAKGLRLSPRGVRVAVSAAGAVAQFSHDCNHDGSCEMLTPQAALEVLDEFCLTWAAQRLEEDPLAMDHVGRAVMPDTARLFQDRGAEVKLT